MRRTKEISAILLSIILLLVVVPAMQVFATAPGNTDAGGASEDNSLSSLSLSTGDLSPAFQYNVTDYTASVSQEVTSVEVNAKTSNENATIESVSGNTDLQPGQNTISIVVKAQNGVPATYKIVVTREGTAEGAPEQGAEAPAAGETETQVNNNPGGITINGHPFDLAAAVPEDAVPQDFSKTTVNCQGQQVEGLKYDKGELTLVYLTTPSTEVKNTLAVYEEASGVFYPFRRMQQGESSYLILLNPPVETGLSQEYSQSTQTIGAYENVPVFVRAGAASPAGNGAGGFQGAETEGGGSTAGGNEFALVYAASSFGNTGWYQYDAAESTFQRYQSAEISVPDKESEDQQTEEPSVEMQGLQNAYKSLEEQYNKKKDTSRKTTAVLIFLIAVLVIVVINLLLRGRRDNDDLEEEEEYEEPKMRKRAQRKQEDKRELVKISGKKRSEDKRKEEARVRKSVRGEGRLREEAKPRRTILNEDLYEEEPARKKARREDEPWEEPKTRKALRREDVRPRRTDRWEDDLTQEPKTRRKTRWEDEDREEPKAYRRSRQPGAGIREQEPAPTKKLEKIEDDFEVIDLEDL